MPYARHIIAESLPYTHFSLAIDETRAVFRILVKYDNFLEEPLFVDETEKLQTTKKLATSFINQSPERIFHLDDGYYFILSECIIDKTLPEFQRVWLPGAHLVTRFDRNSGFSVDIKGGLTYFDHRNTAELIRQKGGLWLFDLWVRNPEASLIDCARSITTTADSVVITNLEDLGERFSAQEVMAGGASSWLNLAYELKADSSFVKPDGWVSFTFKVLDGKTKEMAEDVNWDNFIIEPVDGYCPHRRFAVKSGVGTFKAQALALNEGETLRVKVGVRFWSSRAEASVVVKADEN